MVKFLLPFAIKVIDAAVDKIPDNLDDVIKKLLISLAKKAVSRTDNTVDDQLVAALEKALFPVEGQSHRHWGPSGPFRVCINKIQETFGVNQDGHSGQNRRSNVLQ